MPSSSTSVNSNKMAKDSKVTKAAAKTETVAPPATATTPAKAPRAKAASKTEVTLPVVTAAAPAAATPVVAAPAEAEDTRTADTILSTLQETLKSISSEMTTRMRDAVKSALEASKAVKRELRTKGKRHRKNPEDMTPEERKTYESRRANNAFLKVRPITDELATFMGLPSKSLKSQTDVTKFIANYVKTHNCFDPSFKRRILPDAKLGKLLRVKDGQEVTYLNLQSFLKVHFIKPVVPV
jgi:chromatin remodeling complex protein RSC6